MAEDRLRTTGEDYTEGQKEAAHRILVELVGLFSEYKDEIRIVGGWVPDLLFPDEGHIGSIDVDVLINHLKLREAGYQTMERILLQHGYRRSEEHYSLLKQGARTARSVWHISMWSELFRS